MKRLLLSALLLAFVVALFSGATSINPFSLSPIDRDILLTLRLPRVLFAGVIGAMLALSGSIYQLTLKNPLADSFTTGTASSAAIGAVFGIALGLPLPLVPVLALVTGLAGLMLVYRLSLSRGIINPVTMILAGVVVNIVASALISFGKYYFEESLSSIVFWLMGGFFIVDWTRLILCALLLGLVFTLLMRSGLQLNLLAFDEASAQTMGIDVARLRRTSFILATLLVAVAVSHSGIIGFVGLITPHVARSLYGSDMRKNLTASTLLGALLLMLADAGARSIIPGGAELPVGILTALLGGVFFLYLLRTRREKLWHG